MICPVVTKLLMCEHLEMVLHKIKNKSLNMSIKKMHLLQCIVPVVRGLNLAVVGVGLMLQGLVPRLYEAENLVEHFDHLEHLRLSQEA